MILSDTNDCARVYALCLPLYDLGNIGLRRTSDEVFSVLQFSEEQAERDLHNHLQGNEDCDGR